MSASSTRERSAVARLARLPGRSDTSAWIRILAAAAMAATVLLALIPASLAATAREGIATIGHRTGPHVAATENLRFELAAMDGALANALLTSVDPDLSSARAAALSSHENHRLAANQNLLRAAAVTDSDLSAQRIRDLLDQLGRYGALAARTVQLNDLDGAPNGKPSARTLVEYREATDVLARMLVDAQQLATINSAVLHQDYLDARGAGSAARAWLVVLGAGVIALLIGLQILLRIRMRRRINPALLLATVLVGALTVAGTAANSTAAEQLRVAKQDAFDSLTGLRLARAISHDAHADQIRYLVDPEFAGRYEQAFLAKSRLLVEVPAAEVTAYDAQLDRVIRANGPQQRRPDVAGLLGAGLLDTAFPGEQDAARRTLLAYQRFQRDDRTLRATAVADRRGAIRYAGGYSPPSLHQGFTQYDDNLTDVIFLNQRGFDAAVAHGEEALDGWTAPLPYGGAALAVLLVLLGIRPRLAEYR